MTEFLSIVNNPVVYFLLVYVILIPLAVMFARLLEAKRAEANANGHESKYDSLHWILESVAEDVVEAVEQLAYSTEIDKKEKRDKAIVYIRGILAERGFENVRTETIIVYIEKAVWRLFNKDKPDKVTAPA